MARAAKSLGTVIEDGGVATRLVAEAPSQPALADACWADERHLSGVDHSPSAIFLEQAGQTAGIAILTSFDAAFWQFGDASRPRGALSVA